MQVGYQTEAVQIVLNFFRLNLASAVDKVYQQNNM